GSFQITTSGIMKTVVLLLFAAIGSAQELCPPTWDQWNDSCYYYSIDEVQWINALVGCGNMGGKGGASLVTIFNDDKHDQIQSDLRGAGDNGVWLALYRDPDVGKWNWLQAGKPQVPLDSSLEKYIAPGQDMNDMTKKNMYMKADGLWYLDDWEGKHWTLCQYDLVATVSRANRKSSMAQLHRSLRAD
ncbi:hypothetical protein PFISCL1PPCAC_26778, partial [Pristionchus fissidentatus]